MTLSLTSAKPHAAEDSEVDEAGVRRWMAQVEAIRRADWQQTDAKLLKAQTGSRQVKWPR
jgi:hypothetical protein